jgi:NAD(P)-dependent dehydrogenase (short-subunit alcohol dehydrogenase family)
LAGFTDLSGKTAFITGGATGIGRGIAEAMSAVGMRVAIADIDLQALERTASETGATPYHLDVRDFEQFCEVAAKVVLDFGAIDVVCNNAGVGPVGAIADLTMDDWNFVLDVNLWGVIHGVKAFLPILKQNSEGGHIINTSSMSGLMAGPGFGAYTVSKYGVVALTEVLAMELARDAKGVRASVLLPGPTETAIATSLRNRANTPDSGLSDLDLRSVDLFGGPIPWRTPLEIGEIIVRGLRTGELYLFTHPQLSTPIFARFAEIKSACDREFSIQSRETANLVRVK